MAEVEKQFPITGKFLDDAINEVAKPEDVDQGEWEEVTHAAKAALLKMQLNFLTPPAKRPRVKNHACAPIKEKVSQTDGLDVADWDGEVMTRLRTEVGHWVDFMFRLDQKEGFVDFLSYIIAQGGEVKSKEISSGDWHMYYNVMKTLVLKFGEGEANWERGKAELAKYLTKKVQEQPGGTDVVVTFEWEIPPPPREKKARPSKAPAGPKEAAADLISTGRENAIEGLRELYRKAGEDIGSMNELRGATLSEHAEIRRRLEALESNDRLDEYEAARATELREFGELKAKLAGYAETPVDEFKVPTAAAKGHREALAAIEGKYEDVAGLGGDMEGLTQESAQLMEAVEELAAEIEAMEAYQRELSEMFNRFSGGEGSIAAEAAPAAATAPAAPAPAAPAAPAAPEGDGELVAVEDFSTLVGLAGQNVIIEVTEDNVAMLKAEFGISEDPVIGRVWKLMVGFDPSKRGEVTIIGGVPPIVDKKVTITSSTAHRIVEMGIKIEPTQKTILDTVKEADLSLFSGDELSRDILAFLVEVATDTGKPSTKAELAEEFNVGHPEIAQRFSVIKDGAAALSIQIRGSEASMLVEL